MYSWLGVWGLIPDRRCACQSRSAGVCLSTSPPRDGADHGADATAAWQCFAPMFAPTVADFRKVCRPPPMRLHMRPPVGHQDVLHWTEIIFVHAISS
jgi:hypothetical protein